MQEQKLYEYAVIRLVPKPEREEFFNVGLIMFSKKRSLLKLRSIFVRINSGCYIPKRNMRRYVNILNLLKRSQKANHPPVLLPSLISRNVSAG
jgi:hypothetical protein